MPFEDVNTDLDERRAKVLKMGKPATLKKMKNAGLLNARERLDYLFDKGTFVESGMLATASRQEVRHKAPADGKVAGYGKIDGRWVGCVSNDFSVMGASSALVNLKKMKHIKDVANKRGQGVVLFRARQSAIGPKRAPRLAIPPGVVHRLARERHRAHR